MRLSAAVLQTAEVRTNPLGERELVLRGLSVPLIENLSATLDQYDSLDLTDNDLIQLENFPKSLRLSSLNCGDNAIEGIDARNVGKNVPNLTSLVLTNNRIARLDEIRKLGESCPKLEFLSLMGNPVTRRQHYRLYVIHKIPSLKVLDFTKVKDAERARAKRLAQSAAGAAMESDALREGRDHAAATSKKSAADTAEESAKTFEPGGGTSATDAFSSGANFTREEKERIRTMVAEAESPEEIERIEECVRRGVFPSKPPSPPHLTDDGGRKRSSAEISEG